MNFELKGVQGVVNALSQIESKVSRQVAREIEAGANSIARDAKRMAPVNFGEVKNSIGVEKITNYKFSIFANAYHAPYIEFGTRGKVKVPTEMQDVAAEIKARPKRGTWDDFVDNIFDWIQRKKIAATQIVQIKSGANKGRFRKASGLQQALYQRQLAFLIAKRIYKNGINPQPFMYPAFVKNRAKIVARIEEIIKRPQ